MDMQQIVKEAVRERIGQLIREEVAKLVEEQQALLELRLQRIIHKAVIDVQTALSAQMHNGLELNFRITHESN
jgi:hypothetical protein